MLGRYCMAALHIILRLHGFTCMYENMIILDILHDSQHQVCGIHKIEAGQVKYSFNENT